MTSDESGKPQESLAKSVISRFAHLLSAQGVEGSLGIVFFLYLAWLDSSFYGEINVAIAAGVIVNKVIQFGLYYPQVTDLGKADRDESLEIINRANLIKILLTIPTIAALCVYASLSGFSYRMTVVLILVSLGYVLEAVADSFFADYRVKGRQDYEARIKIASTVAGYGWGFLSAAAGMNLMLAGMFRLISGVVRLVVPAVAYTRKHSGRMLRMPARSGTAALFGAASVFAAIEILGIIYNKLNIFFLESYAGVTSVAYFSATWNIVDSVSVLCSEQLLGWVVFPILAGMWWKSKEQIGPFVKSNAMWLMTIAIPIMFLLYQESDLMIGLLYPDEYADAAWMQRYLVWTILIAFENNLFTYVMMVAKAAKLLLVFAVITTLSCLAYNVLLVPSLGLEGGCLVIIFTKLTMLILTSTYCQIRFRLFSLRDFLPLLGIVAALAIVYVLATPLITWRPAGMFVFCVYGLLVWRYRRTVIPEQGMPEDGDVPQQPAS